MTKTYIALLIALSVNSVSAYATNLKGYTEGAEIVEVPVTRGQIDAFNDITYSQIKGVRATRELKMSLIVPRNNNLKPAIVYFPGGGFKSTDFHKSIELRTALAEAGFVVASIEYRVIPDLFPAPVVDAKSAVRYLRAHADEYGIDPNRIGVVGDSAGGYLAQMMGVTSGDKAFDKGDNLDKSSAIQGAVTMYGIYNLLTMRDGFSKKIDKVEKSPAVVEALMLNGPAFFEFPGATLQDRKEAALYNSPAGHMKGHKPPFLIMTGSDDKLISPDQSAELFKALKEQGNQAEYVLLKGAKHGDVTWYQKPVIDRIVNWFKKTLGNPIKNTETNDDEGGNL